MYYAFKEGWITPSDSLYKFGKILACASTEVETILGYNPKTISLPIEPDTLAYPRFTFYSNLFVSLKNIVEAIQWLNEKHIYLNDLKEANLVYNGVMKIIDIGSIKLKIKEITNDKITIFKSSYNEYEKNLEGTYISPEKLYLPSTGNDPTVKVFRMTTRTNTLLEYTDIPTPTVKLILHPESCLKCIRDDNGDIQHITETVDSIDATYYTKLTNYQRYCKIDIWALGQIMSNLHLQISQEFFELNELQEQINTSILSSMYNLIKNLLELNVVNRPDAAKALSLYIRYLTPEFKKTNRKTLRKSAKKKSAFRLSIKNISTSGGKNTHKRKTYNRRRFRPCQLKRRINIKLN
jgi:serine/threonine protein kinase